MFSLLNSIIALPPAGVEFVEQYLRDAQFPHPVVLREQHGMPGHVCLMTWDSERGAVQYLIPCELIACKECRPALERELHQFIAVTSLRAKA